VVYEGQPRMPVIPDDAVPAMIHAPDKTEETYVAKDQEHKPGGCQYCEGRKFVRSTVRGGDWVHFLLMRYPARCTRCGRRQFVSFLTAALSKTMAERTSHQPKIRQNWRQFTSQSDKPVIEALQRMGDPRDTNKLK